MTTHVSVVRITAVCLFCGAGLLSLTAQQRTNIPVAYQKYIVKPARDRTIIESALNSMGLPGSVVGRSIALIVGVDRYPNMKFSSDRELKPAAEDIRKLTDYVTHHEFFDEVIVLVNDAVNIETLNYFLHIYIPARLDGSVKSRFLFGYTGHGFTDDRNHSYVLQSSATNLRDKAASINLELLMPLVDDVVEKSFHTLVLINACNSGPFRRLRYGSSSGPLVPLHPGAHAIVAAGTNEAAWHYPQVGSGSIFFELLLRGLAGEADLRDQSAPKGDGVITVEELYLYLKTAVEMATGQNQNPLFTDLNPSGSKGGFFFLREGFPVTSGFFPRLRPRTSGISYGHSPAPLIVVGGGNYIRIEPGSFYMGCLQSDGSCSGDEKPPKLVKVDRAFYIGEKEVTVRSYKEFCNASLGQHDIPDAPRFNIGWSHEDEPMVRVSWHNAVAFCGRLGGRLPTDAEWEYAARAGSLDRFSWGSNSSGEQANFGAYKCCGSATRGNDKWKFTAPVGSFAANAFGLYDMSGNVAEWTTIGASSPTTGVSYAVRGGSWFTPPRSLGSRLMLAGEKAQDDIGFRCVLDSETALSGTPEPPR